MSDTQREPVGSLYRLEPDRRCSRIRSDIVVPNSIAWSPDNKVMYFADTHRRRIWAYDYDIAEGVMTQ